MISLAAIVSLLVPVFMGFAFVRACIPGDKYLCRHDCLRLCLGIGTGFGLSSCAFFLWLLTYGAVHVAFIAVETGLAILLGALAARRATGCSLCKSSLSQSSMAAEASLTRWKRPLLVVFGLIFVSACLSFALESRIHPAGQWDAWSIWNLRARFLFRGGRDWRTAFSGTLFWSNLDYPLLLPSLVARSWVYTGTETQLVPVGIAALFTFATVGVLTAGLYAVGQRGNGLLAGIVLLGTASFLECGVSQCADVPLAFFILASILLLHMRDRLPVSSGLLVGTSAALAAWTKNEGMLFFVLLLIAMKSARWPLRRVLMGAFSVVALVAIFKLSLAPPNYLARNRAALLFRDLTSPGRYLLIVVGFVYKLINFGGEHLNPLIAVFGAAFLLKPKEKPGVRLVAIVVSGMCAGVSVVYLFTPFDLAWQIACSLDRVLLQLWPAALFTCFYIFDFPVAPSATRSGAISESLPKFEKPAA